MGNICVSFKIENFESNNERKKQFIEYVLAAIERWPYLEDGQYRIAIQKLEEDRHRDRPR